MYDFAIMVLLLSMQFIREYTNKVDDLVKDRIESQKEEKAKENEEKELVAQQVILKCTLVLVERRIIYSLCTVIFVAGVAGV